MLIQRMKTGMVPPAKNWQVSPANKGGKIEVSLFQCKK